MVLEILVVFAALVIVGSWFYKRFIKDNEEVKGKLKDAVEDITNSTKKTANVIKEKVEEAKDDTKAKTKDVKENVEQATADTKKEVKETVAEVKAKV